MIKNALKFCEIIYEKTFEDDIFFVENVNKETGIMSEDIKKEAIEFDGSVKTNSSGSPILGTLSGPCADIINPTRNGRKYSEQLWERVFNDPIVKEYFECGGVLGELNHPEDRIETDLSKVCVCMSEPPKKQNGQLVGKWDILDTPNGRILKCLCDYGYKIGISSRGTGDIVTDYDGNESVDPDTYEFTAFDVVLLPAVKAARLNYNESLDRDNKTLKMALAEALNKSTEEEKKIMTETLNELNIDVNQSPEGVDINANKEINAADSVGAEVVKSLQEALRKNNELEKEIVELQEKLSVCYAKEANQDELSTKYKESQKQLEQSNRVIESFKSRISGLTQRLESAEILSKKQNKIIEELNDRQEEAKKKSVQNVRTLSESVKSKDAQVASLKNKIQSLNEDISSLKAQSENQQQKLEEDIADLQKDLAIKNKEYSTKLSKANSLVEKYKQVAQTAVNKYIEMQALRLGVNKQSITERLSKDYSFDDVDEVCENLQNYQIARTRLPFDISSGNNVKVKVKESKESILPTNTNIDDEIDSSLEMLAKIN